MELRLKAITSGTITIGKYNIDCAVLDNEERVLDDAQLAKAMGLTLDKNRVKGYCAIMASYLDTVYMIKYVRKYALKKYTHTMLFLDANGKEREGIPVLFVKELEEIWTKISQSGLLSARPNVQELAQRAKNVYTFFAQKGHIEIVDEVTQYQSIKLERAMQELLMEHTPSKLKAWQSVFPHFFYTELFRLNNWPLNNVRDIKRRAKGAQRWTQKLIYDVLPQDVILQLEQSIPLQLKDKTHYDPKAEMIMHSIGNPPLRAQLNQVLVLMQLSDNMRGLWTRHKKLKKKQAVVLKQPFEFTADGHSIVPLDESLLTVFDKALTLGLNYHKRSQEREKREDDLS